MPPVAGYSGTPLVKKLGIEQGMCVYLFQAPAHYQQLLVALPSDVRFVSRLTKPVAFMHLFVIEAAVLAKELPRVLKKVVPDGTIWVSWPKQASKVVTDLTEDVIRKLALPLGLVDVKVCAVDEIWSGLKLVIRKELRSRSITE